MGVEEILAFTSKDPLYDSEEFRVSLVPNIQEKRFDWKTHRYSKRGLFPKASGVPRRHRAVVKALETTQIKAPELFRHLNQSLFLHASNSASLLTFMRYGSMRGSLLPTGKIESQGQVPFSGELFFARKRISHHAVSTYFLTHYSKAYEFAVQQKGWTPESGVAQLRKSQEILRSLDDGTPDYERATNCAEINEKRLAQWCRLSDYETSLVSSAFPVVYGLRPGRLAYHSLSEPAPYGEVAIVGEIPYAEIRCLFVPIENFEATQKILRTFCDFTKMTAVPIVDILLLRPK